MRIRSILACAALAPSLIAAAPPMRLQPSSKWNVEYAADSCRLLRTFGEGNSKALLLLESDAPGQMDMLVIGKAFASSAEEIPARFLPVQNKPMDGRSAKAANGDPGVLWSSLRWLPDEVAERIEKREAERRLHKGIRPPPLDLAEEAATRSQRLQFAAQVIELEIKARRSRSVILETGSLGEPFKAFNKCSRDSLRDWGVDPDLEDRIARPVWAANPAQWFSTADYPDHMVKSGEESEVKVRLLVDASGKVTKCTSLSHFDAPEFNHIVCDKFTKRAKFAPAELADGTKVPSYYVNRVVFRIAF